MYVDLAWSGAQQGGASCKSRESIFDQVLVFLAKSLSSDEGQSLSDRGPVGRVDRGVRDAFRGRRLARADAIVGLRM